MSESLILIKSSRYPFSLTALSRLVITLGLAALVVAVAEQSFAAGYGWVAMVALAMCVAPMGAVSIPGIKAKVTPGDAVSFTCAALFGPAAGVIAAAADGAITSLKMTASPRKLLYNAASGASSMAAGTFAATNLFPAFGARTAQMTPIDLMAAVGVLALGYFLTSTILIAAYIALSQGERLFGVWREHFLWTGVSYLGSGVSAVAACLVAGSLGQYALILPAGMMLIVYAFYGTYFGKIEAIRREAVETRRLSRRALETMIASIGAAGHAVKTNVTRVERLALELGNAAGLDAGQMEALSAAALLHDIGNINLPPSLLEKPAALTTEEFEQVKTHAKAGARIVESMGFSYPVAKIVRHHHERFDGLGYPDGLAGHEIPVEARALAIVDCYNALTLDRAHRPRLSRDRALEVMKEQSGKAFDPCLLDIFLSLVGRADEQALVDQASASWIDDLLAELAAERRAFQPVSA
jgi:putative nucleotidyltransferase with HDIG domain